MATVSRMFAIGLLLFGASGGTIAAADWKASVTIGAPGPFAPPRSLEGIYGFGWSGLTAATADIHFKRNDGRFLLDGKGHTIGAVRALWKMDVTHRAVADAATLLPIEMNQVLEVRSKTIVTELAFDSTGVRRTRWNSRKEKKPSKPRPFQCPNLLDMHSALLYLRSQPLTEGEVHRLVVYPATSPYLATISVRGHESITVPAGTYEAIKLDLKLNKIGKNGELEPHRKFRRATAWISNDTDRLILRIEAQIFVGSVFAELQSVHFTDTK